MWSRSSTAGDPRAVRANELIERQVATLARLVDDLLDTARINRGQVQLRREILELQPVLARAIETSRHLIDARQHRLSVGMPVSPVIVDGDATRLEQVFANLLNNAAKYTPEGGEISVTMDAAPAETAGAAAEIAVRGSEFVVYLPLRSAGQQEEPAKKRVDLRARPQAALRTAKAPD